MPTSAEIQVIADSAGKPVSVVVPIELWKEIESERETAHLLRSDAMKSRLLEARDSTDCVSLEDVRAQLGI